MPPRSAIHCLPESVRKELDDRIVRSCFFNYEEHSLWLFKQGYSISKTAVHRHALSLKKTLPIKVFQKESNIDFMIKCLTIASNLSSVKTIDDLFKKANEIAERLKTK